MTTPSAPMNAELTRDEVEKMRVWIRHYYRESGHVDSAHFADSLCDMAIAHLRSQPAGYVSVPRTISESEADVLGMPVKYYEKVVKFGEHLARFV